MFPRAILSVVLVSAGCVGSPPRRRPRSCASLSARLALDVPDAWQTEEKSGYVIAFPADESFHVRMTGVAGAADANKAEDVMSRFLVHHLSHVAFTQRGMRVEYGGYVGYEARGMTSDQAARRPAWWFALVLTDKNDASKGLVVLATGTSGGLRAQRAHSRRRAAEAAGLLALGARVARSGARTLGRSRRTAR